MMCKMMISFISCMKTNKTDRGFVGNDKRNDRGN